MPINEEKERLQALYNRGLEYFEKGEWHEAIGCFIKVVTQDPDHTEATGGLEEARRQQALEIVYKQGLIYLNDSNWPKATAKLSEVIAIDAKYRNASEKLEEAQKQWELERSYDEALKLFDQKDWGQTIVSLERIVELDSNYKQTVERLATARDELELQKSYERCQTHMKRKNWVSALDIIRKIEQKRPDYPNIQSLKVEAENNIRWERWAREATHHEQDEDWEEAFALYKKILQQNPDFPGLPERLAEARRQRDLKAAYEGAENYLKQEEWNLAREGFEWVLAQVPGYKEAEAKCEIAQNALEGHKQLDEVDKHLEADVLAKARNALDEASRLVPPDSSLHERLVETQERFEERERKLKQIIDNELREADEAFVKRSLVEAQRILRRAKERYPGYKEKEIEDRLRTIEEALRPPRPIWMTVLAYIAATIGVLAGIAGILAFLFGEGIFRDILGGGPTATPTVIVTVVPKPTSTATDTPTLTTTDTLISTPDPALSLVSPEASPEGTPFPRGQDVKLEWEWERDLAENEFFEVRIRLKGEQKFDPIGLTKMSSRFVPASRLTQAGTYEWQVAIVSLSGEEKSVSHIWLFKVQ